MNGSRPGSDVPSLHQGQPIARAGAPLSQAKAVMILLHGRGDSAQGILSLAELVAQADLAYLAPQAARHSWYPYSFLAPLADNEPWLSSALQMIADLLGSVAQAGFPPDRVVLLGFSQGGCLALEFAARSARRYGAVIGLSAGLIGPDDAPREYGGSLAGTPILLGCSNIDPHIPLDRVHESARLLRRMRGEVTEQIYDGMGHTINDDEINLIRDLVRGLTSTSF
jgi:phospholipase/carboxylesterase